MMGRTHIKERRRRVKSLNPCHYPLDTGGVDRVGQGHVIQHQYYKRDAGFLVIQIQKHFHFRADWYRQGEACAWVKQYYVVLRSVLRSRPHLRRYLSRCRHCRIFFLTDPRNTGRRDLHCPFGCRQAHRKQRSTERSVAYYATAEGKVKKKMQNGKRVQHVVRAEPNHPVAGAVEFPASMVRYVAMVASLIEGRRVSEAEVVQMLVRAMRQHSMARRRRMDYVVAQLHKHGP
jgi:hypothetical protein